MAKHEYYLHETPEKLGSICLIACNTETKKCKILSSNELNTHIVKAYHKQGISYTQKETTLNIILGNTDFEYDKIDTEEVTLTDLLLISLRTTAECVKWW